MILSSPWSGIWYYKMWKYKSLFVGRLCCPSIKQFILLNTILKCICFVLLQNGDIIYTEQRRQGFSVLFKYTSNPVKVYFRDESCDKPQNHLCHTEEHHDFSSRKAYSTLTACVWLEMKMLSQPLDGEKSHLCVRTDCRESNGSPHNTFLCLSLFACPCWCLSGSDGW